MTVRRVPYSSYVIRRSRLCYRFVIGCALSGDSGIVVGSQSSGCLDASHTTFLRDRREPLVSRGYRQPGGAHCCTVRDAAGPREGRAVRDCRVHQRTAARCPRRAAGVVRHQELDIAEPGAEFQVADVISNPKLPIRRLVAAGSRPIIVSSTTSGAASPTRGRWRCFTGRRRPLGSSGAASPRAASRQSTTFEPLSCPEQSKARTSSGSSPVGAACHGWAALW